MPCPTCGGLGSDPYGAGGRILLVTTPGEVLQLDEKYRDAPAELSWYGPINHEIARRLIENNLNNPRMRLQVAIVDPKTGQLSQLHKVDQRLYRGFLRDAVTAACPECEWTTCAHPSSDSDIDHRIDHAHGGPTDLPNGGPKCRSPHHKYKTRLGWRQIPQPGQQPGKTILISPHGLTYPTTQRPLRQPQQTTQPATTTGNRTEPPDEPPF